MKKLYLGLFVLGMLSVSAYAVYGVLEWEESDGINTICHYSNGTTITVSSGRNCPVSCNN